MEVLLDCTLLLSTVQIHLHKLVTVMEAALVSPEVQEDILEPTGSQSGQIEGGRIPAQLLPVVACSSQLAVLSSALWFISNCVSTFPDLTGPRVARSGLLKTALR